MLGKSLDISKSQMLQEKVELLSASATISFEDNINRCEVTVAQSCLTLCNPMDYSTPGFSVHGIL